MRARIFDQLHAATSSQCSVAEAEALAFIARCDGEQYRDYLVRCFGFESPLESACSVTPELASLRVTSGPRSRYIAQDLVALGFPAEKLLEANTCPLRRFRDLGQALGWLYVAERNVLTHRRCRDQLARCAPDLAEHASYFDCYGSATDARWKDIGGILEQAAEQVDPEQIAAVAVESYAALQRWLHPITCTSQGWQAAPLRSSAS